LADKPAEVVFGREALKDRRRIAEERVAEITARLQMIASGRGRNLDIKPLKGHKPWLRLRVGDYRVVFRLSGTVILVARVVSRQELDPPSISSRVSGGLQALSFRGGQAWSCAVNQSILSL